MDLDPSSTNPRVHDSQLPDSNLNAQLKDKVVVVVGARRRGRPPRAQLNLPPPPLRQKKDEEDVCFICFDGGSLVLCDRR